MPLTDALCPEALRPQVLIRAAKRLVIKVGSALVNDAAADAPAHVWLAALAEDVAALHGAGADVLIVSSGAVALGRTPLGLARRKLRLSEKQAAAAAGQSRLMQAWDQAFAAQGRPVAQVLLTREDTESRLRWLNARDTLNALFACGAVPIVNENDTVATDEIRYGDNDRLAARVAQLVRADALLLLSDVDGLYDADPRKNPAARHIAYVETLDDEVEALAGGANLDDGVGTGGMATKLAAAKIAGSAGCATVIAEGRKAHPVEALLNGARATVVAPLATPLAAYKQWIAGSVAPAGAVEVDAGAEAALKRGKSLLPSGIVGVSGRFSAGDTVKILGPGGREIARGLSAYDETEIGRLMGRPSAVIAEILGYAAGDEIVHRDNLVWTGS